MTESTEAMIARIDERTLSIQVSLSNLQFQIGAMVETHNTFRSELDTLKAEYNTRIAPGQECNMTNNMPSMPKWAIGIVGASGVAGLGALIILLLLLRKFGLV